MMWATREDNRYASFLVDCGFPPPSFMRNKLICNTSVSDRFLRAGRGLRQGDMRLYWAISPQEAPSKSLPPLTSRRDLRNSRANPPRGDRSHPTGPPCLRHRGTAEVRPADARRSRENRPTAKDLEPQAQDWPSYAEQSDRLVRVVRVLAAAEETFGSQDKASRWLRRPTKVLEGEAPLELLDTTEGAREVEDLLHRIDHGLAV